jgi:hypothetical protein
MLFSRKEFLGLYKRDGRVVEFRRNERFAKYLP